MRNHPWTIAPYYYTPILKEKKMKKLKIIIVLFLTISVVGYSQSTDTNVSDNNARALLSITGG